jgi:hypothetical protein
MSDQLSISKLTGFGRGKVETFAEGEVKIGTSSDCHIRLDPNWDKTVSANHATIQKVQGGWVFEDHSSQGSFIDGRRITRETLRPESVVELGKGGPRLKLAVEQREAVPAPAPRAAAAPVTAPPPPPEPEPEPAFAAAAAPRARKSVNWKPVGLAAAGILALLLLGGAGWIAYKHYSKPPPQDASALDWDFKVDMGEEIYPAFVVASATMKESPFDTVNDVPSRLGDRRGTIGIQIASAPAGAKVHVEILENEIMHQSVLDTVIPSAGQTYVLYPTVSYRFDALRGIKQATPLTITATVSVDGVPLGEKSKTVQVASINDCPFLVSIPGQEGSDDGIKMDWMFAAYVNENHPISDELRREALKTGIVHDFVGYQEGKDMVYQQVFAIWNVLQRRGVRYSNITTTPASSNAVYSQYVRFIDQSINNSQANCVDGSVLFASILRQIGIEPVLVLVPGHMFVGFYVDEEGKQLDFLETTMIGQVATAPPADADSPAPSDATEGATRSRKIGEIAGLLEPAVDAGIADKDSQQSFVAAVQKAREEAQENFGGGGDGSQSVSSYQIRSTVRKDKADSQMLPVAKAREMGVMPIGYQQ